jgi:hypothetical protein
MLFATLSHLPTVMVFVWPSNGKAPAVLVDDRRTISLQYWDDLDRKLLGPDYKKIMQLHYSRCIEHKGSMIGGRLDVESRGLKLCRGKTPAQHAPDQLTEKDNSCAGQASEALGARPAVLKAATSTAIGFLEHVAARTNAGTLGCSEPDNTRSSLEQAEKKADPETDKNEKKAKEEETGKARKKRKGASEEEKRRYTKIGRMSK